jgi:hypothetical protein
MPPVRTEGGNAHARGASVAGEVRMFLVQILLPLDRNDGERQPRALFDSVRGELVERFGGLTAYSRSPAVGLWSKGAHGTERDDVIIVEVMTERLDRLWWADFRRTLEVRFGQETVVVRAVPIVPL